MYFDRFDCLCPSAVTPYIFVGWLMPHPILRTKSNAQYMNTRIKTHSYIDFIIVSKSKFIT
jgi:hypothetical protein